jgi:conjugative transfer region protein TrbK
MQRHDITAWLRVGAIGFAVLAAAATTIEEGREEKGSAPAASSSPTHDPLAAELERCNALTPASGRDEACERAWAENRRRFLGTRQHVAGRPHSSVQPTATSENAP